MITKSTNFLIAATAVTLGTCIPCNAAPKDTGTDVSFRVICTESLEGADHMLLPKENAAVVEVPLYVGNFSELFKGRFFDQKASFFIEEMGADGKVGRKLVAEGPLAKGSRQAFVVTPSSVKGGPVYQIIAFDDTEGSFKMGGTRMINMTPMAARLNVAGTQQEPVPARESAIYPICRKVDDWNMYPVTVELEVRPGEWQKIATQSWRSSDKKRDWVVVSFDAATKKPAIRQYLDIPPWEAGDSGIKGGNPKK